MKIINLLPKEKQRELALRKLFGVVVSLIWISAASFLIALVVLFGVKVYLQGGEAKLKIRIDDLKVQASREENAEIKARLKILNDLVADYRALSSEVPKLSKILREFTPLVPEGVSVTSLRMDAGKKQVEISGLSPTRELVIRLHKNLAQKEESFLNVDYPLENVARPVDVSFHFSFNINPELFK